MNLVLSPSVSTLPVLHGNSFQVESGTGEDGTFCSLSENSVQVYTYMYVHNISYMYVHNISYMYAYTCMYMYIIYHTFIYIIVHVHALLHALKQGT